MDRKEKKVVAIMQARMGSTRLPGKVLMDIQGKPMVLRVVERVKKSKLVDKVVLAIPDTKENDVLANFAKRNNIIYVRGSENNVLNRYYKSAKQVKADVIVRITADCPLIDPEIIDNVIEKHINSDADYTSNVVKRTFPKGLDVEVFNFSALEKSNNNAKTDFQKEHVTPYFLENPKIFVLQNITAKGVLKNPEIRFTVDTKEDIQAVRNAYNHFKKDIFPSKMVVEFFQQKEFVALRKAVKSDIKFLFNLRNQPYVYENSHITREVEWQEHLNWSKAVISGKTSKELFIIEYQASRAGQLRFDYISEQAQVNIALFKEFHGKGIGFRALLLAVAKAKKERKVKTLLADVNKKNIASKKLFEKAGFKLKSEKGDWLKYALPLKVL